MKGRCQLRLCPQGFFLGLEIITGKLGPLSLLEHQIQRGLASPTFPSPHHTAPSSLVLVLHFLIHSICMYLSKVNTEGSQGAS